MKSYLKREEDESFENEIINKTNNYQNIQKNRQYSTTRTFLTKNKTGKEYTDLNSLLDKEKKSNIFEIRNKTGLISKYEYCDFKKNELFTNVIDPPIDPKKNIRKKNNIKKVEKKVINNDNNEAINYINQIKNNRIKSANNGINLISKIRPISAFSNIRNYELNKIETIKEIEKIKENFSNKNIKINKRDIQSALLLEDNNMYETNIQFPDIRKELISNKFDDIYKKKKKKKKKK